jgi:hypothetical protein
LTIVSRISRHFHWSVQFLSFSAKQYQLSSRHIRFSVRQRHGIDIVGMSDPTNAKSLNFSDRRLHLVFSGLIDSNLINIIFISIFILLIPIMLY